MVEVEVEVYRTPALSAGNRTAIRRLLDDAFAGDFSDDDWAHALGGWHALIRGDGDVLAHASVVPRRIDVAGRSLHAGYVEAVAVAPGRQRQGLGSAVMQAIAEVIRVHFALGVLSSGEWAFYERLGWERWRGPTWVRGRDGSAARSPEDDDGVMVLRGPATRDLDLAAAITCEARDGDAW
jgi:aminoglycoside 2'-N-acetyltransferase I